MAAETLGIPGDGQFPIGAHLTVNHHPLFVLRAEIGAAQGDTCLQLFQFDLLVQQFLPQHVSSW